MITFLPVRFDEETLRRYQALFSACYAAREKFTPTTLKWLYAENPEGRALGFDAFHDDELVAHYVCIPTTVRIEGSPAKALLSLNTATHPKFQGQGLFSRLAEMTYQAASDQNFHYVYGVANANSTPGFARKLGFQLVQPLEAMVGVRPLNVDFARASRNAQFERMWTSESLGWRCANPSNRVMSCKKADRIGFHARALGEFLPAYAELPLGASGTAMDEALRTPLRLYLGLLPNGACRFSGYVSIPRRLRPSPLNMIFRPLTPRGCRLEVGHILFSFLDFDAY